MWAATGKGGSAGGSTNSQAPKSPTTPNVTTRAQAAKSPKFPPDGATDDNPTSPAVTTRAQFPPEDSTDDNSQEEGSSSISQGQSKPSTSKSLKDTLFGSFSSDKANEADNVEEADENEETNEADDLEDADDVNQIDDADATRGKTKAVKFEEEPEVEGQDDQDSNADGETPDIADNPGGSEQWPFPLEDLPDSPVDNTKTLTGHDMLGWRRVGKGIQIIINEARAPKYTLTVRKGADFRLNENNISDKIPNIGDYDVKALQDNGRESVKRILGWVTLQDARLDPHRTPQALIYVQFKQLKEPLFVYRTHMIKIMGNELDDILYKNGLPLGYNAQKRNLSKGTKETLRQRNPAHQALQPLGSSLHQSFDVAQLIQQNMLLMNLMQGMGMGNMGNMNMGNMGNMNMGNMGNMNMGNMGNMNMGNMDNTGKMGKMGKMGKAGKTGKTGRATGN